MTAPERSLAQRMQALQRANEIRTKRAALKRDLKAGRADIGQYILAPPAWLETAKVVDLLLAVPKYGRVKANKALQVCRVSPSKTIGGMSIRQRAELLRFLGTPISAPTWPPVARRDPNTITNFQLEVLAQACDLGGVGPGEVDCVAQRLSTAVSSVVAASHALQRIDLLDEWAEPTPAGRAHLTSTLAAA